MKKLFVIIMINCLLLSISFAAEQKGAKGTPQEAEAMVKKAIVYLKAHGKEKAFAEFSNAKGSFVDRDLYISVYDMKGNNLAHGQNQLMIGKNLMGLRDAEGKFMVKERYEMLKTKDYGWQYYKWLNSVTHKIEDKMNYFEKVDDLVISCGAYK